MPTQPITRGNRPAGWRWLSLLAIIAVLLGFGVREVQALAYFFAVPESTIDVYVNEDGTVSLEYYYLFENQQGADPIEYVDIGMPTRDWDLNNVTATLDGQPIFRVEDSTEVDNAIALNLGSRAIPPSQTGEVRARIDGIEGVVFKADTQEAEPYASFQFQPNFFGSQSVTGQTNMTVTLHLPPGLQTEEPRYFPPEKWPGAQEPESGFDAQDRVFYRWSAPNADVSNIYVFGAAFPARLVPSGALMTEVPVSVSSDWICPTVIFLGFFGFIIFSIYAAVTGERKRKLQYLPPRVAVEGNGIKRGLTSVEAAILMQQPMDKILTMILFSVIKKGAAQVVTKDPMKIEVLSPRPEDLRAYETDFLDSMAKAKPAEQRRGLQEMMTNLVRGVSEKMRGFSRKETVDYYQDIMNKAWQQVEAAQTPEMKMQAFDDAMDWTMLDRRFDDRTRDTFGPRPVILPGWWGRYDPTYSSGGGGLGLPSASRPSGPTIGNQPPGGVNLPSLPGADFAGSIVGGMQTFASNVVGDLTAFTGGVTQRTNPPPPPTTPTRGGGGGGRGGGSSCVCACACACAGCACACAGGGR